MNGDRLIAPIEAVLPEQPGEGRRLQLVGRDSGYDCCLQLVLEPINPLAELASWPEPGVLRRSQVFEESH